MIDGIRVMVNELLPTNTIMVSPDMFEKLKAATDGTLDALQKRKEAELMQSVDLITALFKKTL